MKLYDIVIWKLLIFVIFIVFLWSINRFASTSFVPFSQIVAASGVFAFFYMLLFASSWKLFSKNRTDRLFGGALVLFAIVLAVRFTHPLIYDWLPRMDIHFQREDAVFDLQEFKSRIVTAFSFVWMLSAGTAYRYRYLMVQRRLREASALRDSYRDKVDMLQARMDAKHFSPHTIENVVMATMGKMSMDNKDDYLDALLVLADVMHYAIEMQRDDTTVPFAQEWRQVENLVMLGRLCHGDQSMLLTGPDRPPRGQMPMGVLVMPIENVLKYATMTPQTPVRLEYREGTDYWLFTVTNRFREEKRSVIRSNKTGYPLLQRKIDIGGWPIKIERREQGDCFSVRVKGRFIPDAALGIQTKGNVAKQA